MAETKTKVITGKVRFSYAHVFKPKAVSEGEQEKYSVSILIPKKDKATLKRVEAAIEAAYLEGKAKYKLPKGCKQPLRDGDEERPDDEAYEGMMFMNASSNSKPGVVDKDQDPIIEQDEFYSGCWGRASVNFYPYNNVSKGVACGLNNLQKLDDGDRLSGGSTASEDFGDVDDEML